MWRWRCYWLLLAVAISVLMMLMMHMMVNDGTTLWRQATFSSDSCEPCEQLKSTFFSSDLIANGKALNPRIQDPLASIDFRGGRWDNSRQYKLFDNVAIGDLYFNLSSSHRVCLATQTSIERLHELLKIADHWSGPITVAVYIVAEEYTILRSFTSWLILCKPEFYSRLAFHVAVPAVKLPIMEELPNWATNCTAYPDTGVKVTNETTTWKKSNPYPQNHMRNLVRKTSQTSHVFLVDIDIVPSIGMSEALEEFLSTSPECPMCVYVVPTYELDLKVADFPANKSEVVRLAKKKLAVPFHKMIFADSQAATNFTRWESSVANESVSTHISHNVTTFKLVYEPFYVSVDTVPAHEESFVGYGFTRNTQTYETLQAGYKFIVLSPIFTIHWGITKKSRPKWRLKEQYSNYPYFKKFKNILAAKYGKKPK